MSLKFSLGIRVTPGAFKRVSVNDVNGTAKIGDLKLEASKITNLPMESLELIYSGNILEDDQTVTECGLKSGVTLHVLRKNIDTSEHSELLSDADVKTLSQAIRNISLDPAMRNNLHESQRRSVEALLRLSPVLINDPVAIAIISDTELLMRMADFATAKRMSELHPALTETAKLLVASVHANTQQSTPQNQPSNYNDNNYSNAMDDFSDEEEMDSSQSSDSVAGSSSRGGRSQITGSQLAAALASATGAFQSMAGVPTTSHASTSMGSSSGSGSVITPEMLNQAMQNAMATVTPPTNYSPFMAPPPPPPAASTGQGPNLMAQQIQQMHEMGLLDDIANMHALVLTGGDVQAAINLVFSGAVSHDDDF